MEFETEEYIYILHMRHSTETDELTTIRFKPSLAQKKRHACEAEISIVINVSNDASLLRLMPSQLRLGPKPRLGRAVGTSVPRADFRLPIVYGK